MDMDKTFKALIHDSVDHRGRHSYAVWIYDTSKPRGLHHLAAKYAAVRLLDVFSSNAKAEKAVEREGLELLTL